MTFDNIIRGLVFCKSANVTLEESVTPKNNVKITTKNNRIYQIKGLKFEEGIYYGYGKVDLKTNRTIVFTLLITLINA